MFLFFEKDQVQAIESRPMSENIKWFFFSFRLSAYVTRQMGAYHYF